MDSQLSGQLAFVSAGAHGIGRAIADLLAEEGAVVIVADQDAAALQAHGARWRGVVAADLATAHGVAHAVSYVLDTFGRAPDILVNNLGVGDAAPVRQMLRRALGTIVPDQPDGHASGSCRALVPKMAERGGGAVVNTGSDLAKQPEPGFMDYGSCKAGLLYLTKALAKQYAPTVRVNTVLPGPIWSRMWTRPGGIVDQLVAALRARPRRVRQAVSRGSPDADGHRPSGRRRARGRVPGVAAREIHHRRGLDIGGTIRGLI